MLKYVYGKWYVICHNIFHLQELISFVEIVSRFGIKSALLGSAVYYTIDKGVWKDSATTSALYEELEKGVSPYVGELKKQIPYEVIIIVLT